MLWNHRDLLRDHGILIPGESLFDFNRVARAMRTPHTGDAVSDVWNWMGEEVRRWDGTAIVSCEWFCLTPQPLVQRAAEHFGGDIDVVYTAREFSGLVPAAWQESLKLGTGQSLDAFVTALDQDGERWTWWALDPAAVLGRWSPPVPPDRIHVVTVPPIGSD